MEGERDFFISNKATKQLVNRYEKMLKSNQKHFFDVLELENIIGFYLDNLNLDMADNAVDFALNLHPYSIDLKIQKAQVLFDKTDYKQAYSLLLLLEKIESNNSDVFLLLGYIYIVFEDYKKAHQKFKIAIELADSDKTEILLAIALNFEQAHKYSDAIEYLNISYSYDPLFLPIIYELAFCYDKLGKIEKSISYYKEYIDNDPFSKDAWYNLGISYNKTEDYSEAIEAFEYAIAIDDKFGDAYFNKANSLANNEIYSEAIDVYKEYIEIVGDTPEAFFYIAECLERLDDPDMALEYYKKTLKIDNNYAEALFGAGYIYYSKDQLTESLLNLTKAIEIDNNNSEFWFYLGLVNAKLNYKKSSETAFLKASELDPYDNEIWLSYAELHFGNNKQNEAINIIKKGISYDNNAKLNYRLAAYYFHMNDIASATDKLEEGLSIDFHKHNEFLSFCPKAKNNDKIVELIKKYKQK